ncbi:RidA family protein [Maribacter sp. 2307UL18-2]|uniref:RidA family protein n=1 Tax=Maribacter sp. 2307UL18-2 TaxID=3386274 RepID=UPI0039BC4A64
MIDININKLFILVLTSTLASCSMKTSIINNPNVYTTHDLGFSQAVIFNNVIYGSGQVGWNKDYTLQSNSDFKQQFEQTLINIERLLESQKCSWQDVLHLRFYVVDLNAVKKEKIGAFLKQTYTSGYAPATTLLGISDLARENLLIEIEFTAKIKKQ